MKRTLHLSCSELKFGKKIEADLEAGKRVAILCRTKKKALMYAKLFESLVDTVVFTGDSPDQQMKNFELVNNYLKEKQLVIFTSKVTVGSDIQIPWDRMYLDFRGQGCLARDALQMIGRFRRLADAPIQVLVDEVGCTFKGHVMDDAYEYLKTRRTVVAKYKHVLSSDVAFMEGKLQWAPDWLSKLFVLSKAEKTQDQRYILYSEAVQKGWDVIAVQGLQDTKRDLWLKDAADQVEEDKTAVLSRAFVEVDACPNLDAAIENRQALQQQHIAEEADRVFVTVGLIYKRYAGTLIRSELEYAMKHRAQIQGFATLTSEIFNSDDASRIVIRKAVQDLGRSSYIDHAKLFIVQANLIGECLALFGDAKIIDRFDELLPMATFIEHEETIIRNCDEYAVAGTKQKKDTTKAEFKPGECAASTLRRELWAVWGVDLKQVRKGKVKTVIGYQLKKNTKVESLALRSDYAKPYEKIRDILLDEPSVDDVARVLNRFILDERPVRAQENASQPVARESYFTVDLNGVDLGDFIPIHDPYPDLVVPPRSAIIRQQQINFST